MVDDCTTQKFSRFVEDLENLNDDFTKTNFGI